MKVFEYRREEFDSQLLMIEAFDLPMTMFNKTKAQLAATVLEAQRGKDRNDEFDLVFPDTLQIGEKYQYIVDWYKDRRNRDYNKSLVADVAGVPHVFAGVGVTRSGSKSCSRRNDCPLRCRVAVSIHHD